MKIYLLPIFLCISIVSVQSQEALSIDDALAIALKNNYGVLIVKNNTEIAKENNTLGNAGALPNLALNSSGAYANNSIDQKYASRPEIKTNGAVATNLSAALALNWTIFDGGKMFVTKSKLNELEALGELQFKEKLLNTSFDVVVAYFNIIRQKQQLESYHEAQTYSNERLKIVQTTNQAGLSSKTYLLQAQIDLNVVRENSIRQKTVIALAKRELNLLLSRPVDTDFDVPDSIPIHYKLDNEQAIKKLNDNNLAVLSAQKQAQIAALAIKESKAAYLPKVNVTAGYNFSETENTKGNVLQNNSSGPQAGLTFSLPLFQGGNTSRIVKTAQTQYQAELLQLDATKLETLQQYLNAVAEYQTQTDLLRIEKENRLLAKENLDISLQRLLQGQTSSLEVHQAQESYVEARTRLINFQYNLKVAEARIKLLLGEN